MNSKQKLSQVKSFAKSKVKEFRQTLPNEINEMIDWSTATLHMENYSYGNYGIQLISVIYDENAVSDPQQLQDQLENISIHNHLGMYVTVDEEMGQIYFFNKALNNHIRVFHLMTYDEDKFVQKWMKQLPYMESKKLLDVLSLLKELKYTRDDVFIQLTNDFNDENGEYKDYITVEGILKRVNDKEIVLESVGDAKYETVVKVSENWKLCEMDHWQRKYEYIEIEL